MASRPTTIGMCEYCAKQVIQYQGGKFSDGRCYHYDCHDQILEQAYRPMELAQLVLTIESIVLVNPKLASFYHANFPAGFTPEAISHLIELLTQHPVALEDENMLSRLKETQSRAQELCSAQN